MEEDIKYELEDIKYELEDLRSIADGALPPELSKNEAINIINFIENLINRNKELEEYQHKVNEILNVDTDNLDIILVKNNQEGLKKCVTEFVKENQSYRDYFGTPPCYDNADYIPKSKIREKIEEEKKKIKEDLENYKKIEDESWKKAIHQSINIRNRKIEGYEELLQEGDN